MNDEILPIVEGVGEKESVPVLLRRALQNLGVYDVSVSRPFLIKRNKVVKQGELERAIKFAMKDRNNARFIFILLDADEDCPAELGPQLLKRCTDTTQLPAVVVLANKELEAWFLGAKESLRGERGIRPDATGPHNPEDIRGAKEHLSENMSGGMRYVEVDDQPAFAAEMDFELARQKCPSFQKFLRDVEKLVSKM